MNRFLILVMLSVLVAGCSPTPTSVPSNPTVAPQLQSTEVVDPASPTNAPTGIAFTPTSEVPSQPATPLFVQVTSPQDETIVNAPQVDVAGSAPAGTVLSINEAILIVGDDGQFQITVLLEEGPNLIEIVASDTDGNESSQILTVTYEP